MQLKRIRECLDELKKAGYRQHPAYGPLEDLYYELLEAAQAPEVEKYHRYARLPGPYFEIETARKHYRDYCRRHGVKRASLSRNGARDDNGNKCDPPALIYVADKLRVPRYAVWRVRKSLTK